MNDDGLKEMAEKIILRDDEWTYELGYERHLCIDSTKLSALIVDAIRTIRSKTRKEDASVIKMLLEANKEALGWLQGGRPIDNGVKCETRSEAVSKIIDAIRFAQAILKKDEEER